MGSKILARMRTNWFLYLMLVPALTVLVMVNYVPMYGIIIAFKNYNPVKGIFGSPFAGLKWFRIIFDNPDFWQILYNTVFISSMKLVCGTVFTVFVALMLNELVNPHYKKAVQTVIYFPNFISWVLAGGIFLNILGTTGAVNQVLGWMGLGPVGFLSDNRVFPWTLVFTDMWKGFGYGTIIYTSAMAGINPELYEAVSIDGGNRFRQIWHITLPGIRPTIVLVATLSMGNMLKAGFDQVVMLYNPMVYSSGDIIDTYVYRAGLLGAQYSLGTAADLFRAVIGIVLITLAYKMADRFANYRIF